ARCVQVSNFLAPEHLHLQVAKPDSIKSQLVHYGCLFIGYHSTVPFGAYMAGPNHTLPTNSAARFCGSLNPFTFLRAQTWVQANASPQALASQTAKFATAEGLHLHAAAATARAQSAQESAPRPKGKAKR
ncbi:MAG: histidinol dehydrogenase, partial [Terriglobales bacterium]